MFYRYNVTTGEYLGESSDAFYTLDGKLINGYTTIEPPTIPEGKQLFFENGSWVLKDIPKDYRGLWVDIDGNTQNITELNVIPQTGYAKEKDGVWYFADGTEAMDITIKKLKEKKLQEIKTQFNNIKSTRTFKSSLGFNVDNRRDGLHFDKDNIESLIDLGVTPINFKDADGVFHSITLDDLKTIKMEMIKDGLAMYQEKWQLENQVAQATTIDEIKAITWAS